MTANRAATFAAIALAAFTLVYVLRGNRPAPAMDAEANRRAVLNDFELTMNDQYHLMRS